MLLKFKAVFPLIYLTINSFLEFSFQFYFVFILSKNSTDSIRHVSLFLGLSYFFRFIISLTTSKIFESKKISHIVMISELLKILALAYGIVVQTNSPSLIIIIGIIYQIGVGTLRNLHHNIIGNNPQTKSMQMKLQFAISLGAVVNTLFITFLAKGFSYNQTLLVFLSIQVIAMVSYYMFGMNNHKIIIDKVTSKNSPELFEKNFNLKFFLIFIFFSPIYLAIPHVLKLDSSLSLIETAIVYSALPTGSILGSILFKHLRSGMFILGMPAISLLFISIVYIDNVSLFTITLFFIGISISFFNINFYTHYLNKRAIFDRLRFNSRIETLALSAKIIGFLGLYSTLYTLIGNYIYLLSGISLMLLSLTIKFRLEKLNSV